jgi:SAM-dependent methyltransferase
MFNDVVLRMLSGLSDGIRLCREEGAASGRMMGYACTNHAHGRGFIGRWIDRRFLNYPGWEGVRQRRMVLARLILLAIDDLHREGVIAPAVLDIASGTADYLFDAMLSLDGKYQVVCVDSSASSIDEGDRKACALGLDCVRFKLGDAMDADGLARLASQPNLVISSGFYELLTTEGDVRRSLKIIADLLPAGGRLIVSHQKAKPRLSGIGRLLSGGFAGPVQLQMRSPQVVETLLRTTGFEVATRMDAANLYELFLARRM